MYDLDAELARLSTAIPIALFPVRIETRFSMAPAELRIRVYPDEILADLHRRPLTQAELSAAERFWVDGWIEEDEPAAWCVLVAEHGTERAAWIAATTTPTNLAQRPNGPPELRHVETVDALLPHAMAALMPVAWTAIAYRDGDEIHRAVGADIATDLHLSFQPDLDQGEPYAGAPELELDPELVWAIDFDAALAKGMAMVMPLTNQDLEVGFDRLLVVGVRTHESADDSAAGLTALFEAHHYTRGLALVRQDTPTNSSERLPSGYPPSDDPDRSFVIERGAEVVEPGSDGEALGRALGLHTTPTFDHVDGTRRREQAAAAAMNQALWSCTLGYYLAQMAHPLVSPADIALVREHFIAFVRGRGPLPAIRVGAVPYGILPATSTALWTGEEKTIEPALGELLVTWREAYLDRIANVPRVGATTDPDADLLAVLGRVAASPEVRVREVTGPGYFLNVLQLLGYSGNQIDQLQLDRQALAQVALDEAGISGVPRIAEMTLADTAPRIGRPLVTAAPTSEQLALDPNYIAELRTSTLDALRAAGEPNALQFQNPLLYHILRQATLVEYARVGIELAIDHGTAAPVGRLELELVAIMPDTPDQHTVWQRFAASIPALTGGVALGTWLVDPASTDPERAPVRDHQAALLALEPLPTAELARLLAETLDICSHRLDAWLTSLATRRLAALRASSPGGIHVGAFAWVEHLKPRPAPRPGTAGGFIHAPSATHAATAAILRNAHLSRAGEARDLAAVDLSSRRVRGAFELIEGVRQGQPLGAVLGYRFERALHEAGLDQYIAPFRTHFPLGRDPAMPAEASGERIAARNVVDGLALQSVLAGAIAETQIPWSPALSFVAPADRPSVAPCLVRLEDAVDATADLLLAESVYQAVQGNTDRAAATLAALAGTGDIPHPAIARVPQRGLSVTHRVAVVLGPGGAVGWPASVRGTAEPRLDAWVGSLLPPPATVTAVASYPDPTPEDATHRSTVTVALQELDLGPLDVLALARATATDGEGELRARIAARVSTLVGARSGVTVDHGRVAGMVSFLEALELAGLLGELVDQARALGSGDLIAPGMGGAVSTDEADLVARAAAASTAAGTRRTALVAALAAATAQPPPASLDGLRAAMWDVLVLGVAGAMPAGLDDVDGAARAELVAQATDALAELDRRLATAGTAAGGLAKLAAIFGPAMRILPTFQPYNRGDLESAIAHGPTLVGDPYATRRWMQAAARVRPPVAQLRLAQLTAEALGPARLDLRIAQLPHVPGRAWVGGQVDAGNRPHAGTLSVAMHRPAAIANNAAWAGLLLDQWNEVIPSSVQDTAFAVHHDSPGAEAAQCILLAVAPVRDAQTWTLSALSAILHETFDLAALRVVDAEELGVLGLLAPTTLVAANLAGDTVTTDLSAQSIGEDAILAPE